MDLGVERFDRAVILRPPIRTDEGFLRADAFIAKPGVLEYRNADGSITRELIPPETLHDSASLETLKLKPVTLEHPNPNDYPDGVTPLNYANLSVGSTGQEVDVADEGDVRFPLVISSQAAVMAVQNGIREVSPGYKVDIERSPGTHPVYGNYDSIQRNRRYNHLAITALARGGRSVRLRADAAIIVDNENPYEDSIMEKRETAIQGLINVGYSRADAIAMVDKGRTDAGEHAEEKKDQGPDEEMKKKLDALAARVDQLAAAFEKMKPEEKKGDQDPDLLAKKPEEKPKVDENGEPMEEEEKKADAARIEYANRRAKIAPFAATLGIEKLDSLGNLGIEAAIVGKLVPDAPSPKDRADGYNRAIVDQALAGNGAAGNPWGAAKLPARQDAAGSKTESKNDGLDSLDAIAGLQKK